MAVFSLFSCVIFAQGEPSTQAKPNESPFDANEVIFGHVLDAHEFHFFSYKDGDGKVHQAIIPLPVILYSPQKGFSFFMSSKFHDGEDDYKGYTLITEGKLKKLDAKKYHAGQIVAVDETGQISETMKVYDFSLTRNVIQLIIALTLLVWVMLKIARRYKRGEGVMTAPKGSQSLFEPIITFIQDDVAKPNLGRKYSKYLPYLL
ncbi:MAG TPA: F0F1 ATP synthase subunit A, partial [Chitinophagaceae bacterium]